MGVGETRVLFFFLDFGVLCFFLVWHVHVDHRTGRRLIRFGSELAGEGGGEVGEAGQWADPAAESLGADDRRGENPSLSELARAAGVCRGCLAALEALDQATNGALDAREEAAAGLVLDGRVGAAGGDGGEHAEHRLLEDVVEGVVEVDLVEPLRPGRSPRRTVVHQGGGRGGRRGAVVGDAADVGRDHLVGDEGLLRVRSARKVERAGLSAVLDPLEDMRGERIAKAGTNVVVVVGNTPTGR